MEKFEIISDSYIYRGMKWMLYCNFDWEMPIWIGMDLMLGQLLLRCNTFCFIKELKLAKRSIDFCINFTDQDQDILDASFMYPWMSNCFNELRYVGASISTDERFGKMESWFGINLSQLATTGLVVPLGAMPLLSLEWDGWWSPLKLIKCDLDQFFLPFQLLPQTKILEDQIKHGIVYVFFEHLINIIGFWESHLCFGVPLEWALKPIENLLGARTGDDQE